MAVRIRSLVASAPVVVPLSTGEAVRLSPGQVSAAMPRVVVANNAKVDKLRERGLIEVETVDEEAAADEADETDETDETGQTGQTGGSATESPDQPEPAPDTPAARRRRSGKSTEPTEPTEPTESAKPTEPSD